MYGGWQLPIARLALSYSPCPHSPCVPAILTDGAGRMDKTSPTIASSISNHYHYWPHSRSGILCILAGKKVSLQDPSAFSSLDRKRVFNERWLSVENQIK